MTIVEAITNGFRAWGASSLLMALPVVGPFVIQAVKGALTTASFELKTAANASRRRALRVFLFTLWLEGYASQIRVNLWIVLGFMVFVAGAGTGIFVSTGVAQLGSNHPLLQGIMLVMWALISTAGWVFTVSTAKKPAGMGTASLILAFVFMMLSLGLEGSRFGN